jgi:hypothetical protein
MSLDIPVKWLISKEKMAFDRNSRFSPKTYVLAVCITVDQEVGGSSPPSCTNEIKSLAFVIGQQTLRQRITVSNR